MGVEGSVQHSWAVLLRALTGSHPAAEGTSRHIRPRAKHGRPGDGRSRRRPLLGSGRGSGGAQPGVSQMGYRGCSKVTAFLGGLSVCPLGLLAAPRHAPCPLAEIAPPGSVPLIAAAVPMQTASGLLAKLTGAF